MLEALKPKILLVLRHSVSKKHNQHQIYHRLFNGTTFKLSPLSKQAHSSGNKGGRRLVGKISKIATTTKNIPETFISTLKSQFVINFYCFPIRFYCTYLQTATASGVLFFPNMFSHSEGGRERKITFY